MVVPDVASAPDQAPLAVQDVALELVQVRVALWPGITALGLMVRVTIAFSVGCTGVTAGVELLLQPERTKAERRNKTETKE